MSIQIYRKFHRQELKIFRKKKQHKKTKIKNKQTLIFFIFLLKTWIVGTH